MWILYSKHRRNLLETNLYSIKHNGRDPINFSKTNPYSSRDNYKLTISNKADYKIVIMCQHWLH